MHCRVNPVGVSLPRKPCFGCRPHAGVSAARLSPVYCSKGRTVWTAARCVRRCVRSTSGGISSSGESLALFSSPLLLLPRQLYTQFSEFVQGYQARPRHIIHACNHRCQYREHINTCSFSPLFSRLIVRQQGSVDHRAGPGQALQLGGVTLCKDRDPSKPCSGFLRGKPDEKEPLRPVVLNRMP